MREELIKNIVIFLVAAFVATILIRKFGSYLWGRRKGEPIMAYLARARREQEEKEAIQRNLNMNPQKAFHVRLINTAISFGFLCFGAYISPLIGRDVTQLASLCFFGYVLIGLVVCSIIKVVPAALLSGLNWGNRLNLRLYYVWLWPLSVTKAIRRKN